MSFRNLHSNLLESLNKRIYWQPTKQAFEAKFGELEENQSFQATLISILNELTSVLQQSESGVHYIQRQRIEGGEMEDQRQSSVSVAGNNYQALIAYSLELNRLAGNLPQDIHIVLRPKEHPILEKYAVIRVGGEEQKPDVDVMVYSERTSTPVLILSCKTSLRERAGQTYRWKVLMDVALCTCKHEVNCPLHEYHLEYQRSRRVLVNLVTADLYDEAGKAQQRGMFALFDRAYMSKRNISIGKLLSLSEIIRDLRAFYG